MHVLLETIDYDKVFLSTIVMAFPGDQNKLVVSSGEHAEINGNGR